MKSALFTAAALIVAAGGVARSQSVPVHMVVTVETKSGGSTASLSTQDVMAYHDKTRLQVEDWVPLQGEHGALQLVILIDDGAEPSLGLQFDDIRRFMNSQPATTEIGVSYMRNGSALDAQKLTTDRELAAKSLRLPLGSPGIAASPYLALVDLIKKWPASNARREVLMISSGIDLYSGSPPTNPYLDQAIDQSQRAGILVHSIYFPAAGHLGHSAFRLNWGRDYLSRLGDATGGEAYWQGVAPPVSFEPYLKDLAARLTRQYLLTFRIAPEKKAQFQSIKLRTEVPGHELIAAERVYVPAR